MKPTSDKISGTHLGDDLVGTDSTNLILGKKGDDTLTGGAGDDTLTGGAGNDKFVFTIGGGHDVVTDYQPGEHLSFEAGSYNGPAHVLGEVEVFNTTSGKLFEAMNDDAGNALLKIVDNGVTVESVTLVGVSVTQLNTAWLEFV